MFIARNTYEAYFEQIGLEKHWGGPPHLSYSRENTAAMTKKINNTVLKKVDIHIMNADKKIRPLAVLSVHSRSGVVNRK